MKKFLAIIAIASFAVACNNSSEAKDTADSAAAVVDSTANAAIDSISNVADSATKVIDSTTNAVVDSLKK